MHKHQWNDQTTGARRNVATTKRCIVRLLIRNTWGAIKLKTLYSKIPGKLGGKKPGFAFCTTCGRPLWRGKTLYLKQEVPQFLSATAEKAVSQVDRMKYFVVLPKMSSRVQGSGRLMRGHFAMPHLTRLSLYFKRDANASWSLSLKSRNCSWSYRLPDEPLTVPPRYFSPLSFWKQLLI